MSNKATTWAFLQKLPPLEKLVLLVLADCHNGKTGQCNPSIAHICEDTGASRSTIKRSLENLVKAGYVAIKGRSGPKGLLSNQYNFKFSFGIQPKYEDEDFSEEVIGEKDENAVAQAKPPQRATKRESTETRDPKAEKLWGAIVKCLGDVINVHSWDTWIRRGKAIGLFKDSCLTVQFPAPEWGYVPERWGNEIREAAEKVGHANNCKILLNFTYDGDAVIRPAALKPA